MVTMMMALLLGAAAPVTFAVDGTASNVPQNRISVSMADYDFSKPHDVQRFDQRTRIAVEDLCGTASSADLAGQNAVKHCRDIARALLEEQRDIRIAAANSARPALARR